MQTTDTISKVGAARKRWVNRGSVAMLALLLPCAAAAQGLPYVAGVATAQTPPYKQMDFMKYVLHGSESNYGARVEVALPMEIDEVDGTTVGFIHFVPTFVPIPVWLDLSKLDHDQIKYLRDNCTKQIPCTARWDITLMGGKEAPAGWAWHTFTSATLDGWR